MRKKILFVTNHFRFSNGVASVLRSLIANLDETKYDISLLAVYEFNKEFAAPIMDKITVVQGYDFYFRGFDKLVNLIPPIWLYKKFIKQKYDLEIAFQFGIPTKMIAVSPNPHKLCWMHGYDTKMILREYYQKFPKVINVSKAGRDKMIADGFDANMCDYCYNIIDEQAIIEASKEHCPITKTHKYCFITVGRLAPDKAFMRYLECIKEIVKTQHNAEFWIVGGGSEEEKMRQFIIEQSLDEYVIMIGQQSNPYKYLKEADVYFCSSYREGFSTSCQEAALLGIPVVSVEVNGAKELIEVAGCGSVLPNNENGIIQGIISLLSDESTIENYKKKAYSRRESFYKETRINKIVRILEDAIHYV